MAGLAGDFIKRKNGYATLDAIGPQYLQSQQESCGATALAFALTRLGDHIFEQDIAKELDHRGKGGSSLTELGRAALKREFHAKALYVNDINSLPAGPGISAILHLNWGHFIVVMQRIDNELLIVDPAVGAVLRVDKKAVAEKWSGYALIITPRAVVIDHAEQMI